MVVKKKKKKIKEPTPEQLVFFKFFSENQKIFEFFFKLKTNSYFSLKFK
jgi:hypothetical protein